MIYLQSCLKDEKMAKIGRPLIESEPKNVKLTLMLTKTQADTLKDVAEKLKINRTDVLLRGLALVREEMEQ